MAAIEIRGLTVKYDKDGSSFTAIDGLDLRIAKGEFVCVVGPSGCGKSTLLSVLAGLREATSGEVLIEGKPLTGTGTDRAVVFQHYSLFPWMSARKNVQFALEQVRDRPSKELANVADAYLKRVGLGNFLDKLPAELSGGMQQRVAIARALALDPDILLMDEPFGALDAKTRMNLQELLLHLWGDDDQKKTIVFVTHDIEEALVLADRIVFMTPKRIHRDIPVDFPRPRDKSAIFADESYYKMRLELLELFDYGAGADAYGDFSI
jgi:NitT/TauT family transport system ATP-binding protein